MGPEGGNTGRGLMNNVTVSFAVKYGGIRWGGLASKPARTLPEVTTKSEAFPTGWRCVSFSMAVIMKSGKDTC